MHREYLINICWINGRINPRDHCKVAPFYNFQIEGVRGIEDKRKPPGTDPPGILFPFKIDSLMDGTLTVLKWMLLKQFSKWLNNIVFVIFTTTISWGFFCNSVKAVCQQVFLSAHIALLVPNMEILGRPSMAHRSGKNSSSSHLEVPECKLDYEKPRTVLLSQHLGDHLVHGFDFLSLPVPSPGH